MKKSVLLLLLLIVTLQPFFAQNTSAHRSRRTIFLKSQMYLIGVRSASPYSVTGIKEETWKHVTLEFISSDNHIVTIEQDGNSLYSQLVSLPQNNEIKRIDISLTFLKEGTYTMTVTNLINGEITSGDFTIK